MSFTAELKEVLRDHSNGNKYKVLRLKITIDPGKFAILSPKTYVTVGDGTNEVSDINNGISGDQKNIEAIFTTDAFGGFSASSTIKFGYDGERFNEITGFNPSAVVALSPYLASLTYIDLDSATYASL